MYGMWQLSLTT